MKIEHIDKFSRGKKSGIHIGSRSIGHHLYKYEEEKYKRALKYGFLEINSKDRDNLRNIWDKICSIKGWNNYTLIKDLQKGIHTIYINEKQARSGNMNEMKTQIRNLAKNIIIR